MKETAKYFRAQTTSQATQSLEEQSRECREFSISLEIEKIREKELFKRTKIVLPKIPNAVKEEIYSRYRAAVHAIAAAKDTKE